ncbi:MAG: hypothetical protein WKG07_31450 [Hymenobacter sp.]
MRIKYQNNSPDSLRQLWFKLYPNIYQEGARRARAGSRPRTSSDGVKIEQLSVNGQRY